MSLHATLPSFTVQVCLWCCIISKGGHACRAIANFTWAFPTVKSQISNVKKVDGYGNNVF